MAHKNQRARREMLYMLRNKQNPVNERYKRSQFCNASVENKNSKWKIGGSYKGCRDKYQRTHRFNHSQSRWADSTTLDLDWQKDKVLKSRPVVDQWKKNENSIDLRQTEKPTSFFPGQPLILNALGDFVFFLTSFLVNLVSKFSYRSF